MADSLVYWLRIVSRMAGKRGIRPEKRGEENEWTSLGTTTFGKPDGGQHGGGDVHPPSPPCVDLSRRLLRTTTSEPPTS